MVLPFVIIIGGACGSGKSTIGKELARRISYTFVDADDFHSEENKAKMSRGEPLSDSDRMPWLARVAEIWVHESETAGGFVVACSALKKKYRSLLLESDGKGKVVVMLVVPADILRKRTAERNDHFAKSSLIPSQLAALELPPENGSELGVLKIDGTRQKDEIVEEIISKTENHFFNEMHSNQKD